MRRTKSFFLTLAAVATVLASCQKNDLPNKQDADFGVQLKALNPRFAVGEANTKSAAIAGDSIVWDSAQLVISSIKFEAELKSLSTGRDSIEIEYKWYGPALVNLLDSGLTLGNFVLAPGIYDEIELTVSGEADDAGDTPVFYLAGTYKSSRGDWPIVVEVNRNIKFKTEKQDVEITDAGVDMISEIQIYLDKLMFDVDQQDLENAQLTDGKILISAGRNPNIYETIFENLQRDCRSEYREKNHNEHHWHKYSNNDHQGDDD